MRMDSSEGPLVSFCVKCCNQERYIGEALAGAFAQTYRPLEVIVSDDASSDKSWEIIEASVAAYRRTPNAAPVVLNRNGANLGNLGNWLVICSLAKGELLVKADGDDVSFPERTAKIVEAWRADGSRAMVVSHAGALMGPRGQRMGPMWRVSATAPAGAVMAFHRRVGETFGGADDLRIVDDELFALRARMLGPELVIPDRLVRYRLGTGVSNSLWRMREPMCRGRRDLVKTYRQARRDLEKVRNRMSSEAFADWQVRLDVAEARTDAELMLFTGENFAVRREGYRRIGPVRALSVWQFFKCAYLLPRPLGDGLLFCYAVVRYVVRRLKGVLGR